MHLRTLFVLACLVPAPLHAAQLASVPAQRAFESWRAASGPGWHAVFDARTGRADFLGGGRVELGAVPRGDAEWFERARAAVAATAAATGIEPETLVDERVKLVPLGLAGGTDKVAVRFRQASDGVPVRGGFVNALFDTGGAFLALQSTALPSIAGAPTRPAFGEARALELARAAFERDARLPGSATRAPELVLVRDEGGGAALAWELDLQWHEPGFEPEGFTYWIDATDGGVVRREGNIHRFDVGGTVSSNATPGTKPDTGSNPPQLFPMAHLRVSSAAGTAFTDAAGAFLYPGVVGPLLCTFEYVGTFASVTNGTGAEHVVQLSLSGTGNAVTMNAPAAAQVTAQANAFRTIGALRAWIRAIDPTDATADFQVQAVVNLAITCGAFFNGSSIQFGAASSPCVDMAYSTVVTHEEGHWLNVLYGTGNDAGGMGEGNADLFAVYLHDTPLVGEDVCGAGCHARDGNNTTQFCGDCCPGCYGSPHENGEVWMGAAWKVRERLNATHGDAQGDLIADSLFLGWMNAYDQTQIESVIELQWLVLDDDDGNVDNGTPNHAEIDGGFREQGFPGHDVPSLGTPLCFGDGSGAPCPCVNEGSPGGGCANGTGDGCVLGATPDAGGTLSATGAIPGQPGLFFQGTNLIAGGDGVGFGDGLRCCGSAVVRLDVVVPDGAGVASTSGVQAAGGAQSGDTRCYQFWYRDPQSGPCGLSFNLSNAVRITWP